MKKCFGIIMVAVFAVALMAGGTTAQANYGPSVLDIAALSEGCSIVDGDIDAEPSGPFVVGDEWLETKGTTVLDVDLGNALVKPCGPSSDRSDILYRPICDISFNTLIEVTVVNGGILPNADYALYDCERDTKVADLVDFRIDGVTGGYSKMYFEFDFSQEEYGEVIEAYTVLTFTEDGDAPNSGNRPVLLYTNGQLRTGDMTIQVTGAWDDALGLLLPLECPKTPDAEVLVKIFGHEQLTARVEYRNGADCVTLIGHATSTIDVFADTTRSKFCVTEDHEDYVYPAGDTGLVNSVAEILVIDAGENGDIKVDGVKWGHINEGICLTDPGTGTYYILTLNGNQDAIIQIEGINGYYDGVKLDDAKLYKTTSRWTIDSTFNSHDLRDCEENDLLITVDGTTVIQTAVYSVDLVVYSYESSSALTLLSDDTAFIWKVNAVEVRIPYILVESGNVDNFMNYIEITNRANHKAELWMEAIITKNGSITGEPDEYYPCQTPRDPIVTLEPCSVSAIDEGIIAAFFDNIITGDARFRVGLTLFIAVDENMADVSAFQYDKVIGGRTDLPVLYNAMSDPDGGLDKLRRWWQ